ncbi:hypothetical protein HKX48_008853 [Thoreauomyces humboldtii]|nr:hypothetical protein HKX48_008853 [Thoreauomyces humboldtii]
MMKATSTLLSKPIVHPNLAAPIKVGAFDLKNKFVMASLTRNRGVVSNEVNAEYYAQRAGAGMILSEGTLIEPQGSEWSEAPGIYDERTTQGWKKTVDAVHAAGGIIVAQLWHLGRVCHPYLQANLPNVSASAVPAEGGKFRQLDGHPGYVTPTSIEDPSQYAAVYRRAAENAKKAGFDGVELHSANGYLANQFIDGKSNVRTDAYGGSPENRARFTLEALDALISVYGPERVGIKLSPSGGYNSMRGGDQDLPVYVHLLREIEKRGIAYVQVLRYLPDFSAGGKPVDVALLRKLVTKVAFWVNGGFEAEEAEEWIKTGKADAIVFGRNYITTPDLAERFSRGVPQNKDLKAGELYNVKDGNPRLGYSDYPFFGEKGTEDQVKAAENLSNTPHN